MGYASSINNSGQQFSFWQSGTGRFEKSLPVVAGGQGPVAGLFSVPEW
jgi:hypothetical protein